ncbi:MAG: outer membrane beta-barrel protein [Planctomycetaceae bacterium]|nr:outer membrane beta-barrel protein [Planctomycetaceae bacterium]
MRSYFFLQFFLLFGIFFPVCVGVPSVWAQNDPFLSPEKVPFPFINEPDQNTQTQSASKKKSVSSSAVSLQTAPVQTVPVQTAPVQTVPVPPDTFVANHDEGYVPNIYYQVAPDPPSVLRPRYRNSSTGNIGNTAEKQSDKFQKTNKSTNKLSKSNESDKPKSKNKSESENKTSDTPDKPHTSDKLANSDTSNNHPNTSDKPETEESLNPIRQVVASDAPAPPTEYITDSVPASPTPNTISSLSFLKYPVSLLPQKKRTNSVTNQQGISQSPYTVNNTHSGDDLTCGDDGCSSHLSLEIFRHLSKQTPKRGVCDSCGFSQCINKTVGAWYFDGWFTVGAFMNTHYPENRNNTPLYYNDRNAEAVMNQLYLTFGRRVHSRGGRWDWGGRVDLLYGTDYFFTGSVGLETRRYSYISPDQSTLEPLVASLHWNSNSGTRRLGTVSLYGLSLPQAYAELFIPAGNGVTVKAGHFYSGMGIESAMSPENFFYSHSYSFMYGSPTTLTGMTATAKLSSRVSALLGFSRGWDIFDKANDNLSGLAGLEWKSFDKRTALSLLIHSGEESFRNGDNRTSYALTVQHQLAPQWYYALEHTFGYEKNGAALNLSDGTRGTARWYSFAQYLQWKWNERFALGLRGEWFRDNGQSRIQKDVLVAPGIYYLEGEDYFQITLGTNWKPTRYITIRPEIRYDWSNVVVTDITTNTQSGVYGNNKKQMFSFAIDGIFRF